MDTKTFESLTYEGRDAYFARRAEEFRNIIQGKDIYNDLGRVVESETTGGKLVAVKIGYTATFRRSEAAMMNYAHEVGVLAPRVLGCYDVKPKMTVTVADRVPGQSLDKVWHDLTESQRKSIESQLWQQVQEMRRHTQPYIGRIGNIETYDVFDDWNDDRDFGPFESEKEFDEWCLNKIKFLPQKIFWWPLLSRMRNKSSKFVLTHGELAARNIMVHDGQITGITDWRCSGFYPEYMEYALVTVIHENIEDWWLPVLKRVLKPAACLRCKFVKAIKGKEYM
ncbi:hypothetical protein ASPBRDRAFT_41617 [Aspergillus brasiliensis CBS 101740]|uniref:Aminoglycoside phosphotransferase domain-containing protein n=1 Tax=Aspergillus brasiliensis (strain CBS 101740 / IMI 381727 / IBT 21946) TaxID=767769 RepID=A0A1L9UQI8_ASPBC|nr:hypothetical protein ASPBRDRAFT_41617 [Aspergillus brasiliensis CBS 101740]